MKPPTPATARGLPVRIGGGVRLPLIAPPAPGATVADVEAAALAYAADVAASQPNVTPRRLTLAAFEALAQAARLTAYDATPGRWSSRPPAPGVQDARDRLTGRTPTLSPTELAPF